MKFKLLSTGLGAVPPQFSTGASPAELAKGSLSSVQPGWVPLGGSSSLGLVAPQGTLPMVQGIN